MLIQVNQPVTPLIWQDYSDWHKNRTAFGVWYIEIERTDLVNYCQNLRDEFADFLCDDYQRQFHITLFVNGFFVDNKQYADDFDKTDLLLQINSLKKLNLSPFSLTLANLDSFLGALFIHILPDDNLLKVREVLKQTHQEISPSHYIPHITLGFYKDNFLGQEILDKMAKVNTENIEFNVTKLIFGTYNPKELQGKLTPQFIFHFV